MKFKTINYFFFKSPSSYLFTDWFIGMLLVSKRILFFPFVDRLIGMLLVSRSRLVEENAVEVFFPFVD